MLRNNDNDPPSRSTLYLWKTGEALNPDAAVYENYTSSVTSTIKVPRQIAGPFDGATIMDFDSSGSQVIRTTPVSLRIVSTIRQVWTRSD